MTETKEQQGCPYCHEPFKNLLVEPGIAEYITLTGNIYSLTTEIANFGFTNFPLSYCPCCGRKLGDHD
ncbi:hypothetical protein IWT25_02440 [Secundilactobacillus pentosiphilus]|uniref:Uncharacterized protein n=1 Tax=Secundilactobacillus pentosiphilus TaxID=1714682 RepID=A0A1Z5IZU1_9LACO|nr:hypothetical protein [Secundilactobacillus pentosiphilus]GAX07092.1 hypothetical protein IWT25_02440 [Secundilactobacillus pentosiphilus]